MAGRQMAAFLRFLRFYAFYAFYAFALALWWMALFVDTLAGVGRMLAVPTVPAGRCSPQVLVQLSKLPILS